jgi:cytochrome P450
VVSSCEDGARVSVDTDSFTTTAGIIVPPNVTSVPAFPAEADPPRHTRMRRALPPFFNADAVNRFARATRRTR